MVRTYSSSQIKWNESKPIALPLTHVQISGSSLNMMRVVDGNQLSGWKTFGVQWSLYCMLIGMSLQWLQWVDMTVKAGWIWNETGRSWVAKTHNWYLWKGRNNPSSWIRKVVTSCVYHTGYTWAFTLTGSSFCTMNKLMYCIVKHLLILWFVHSGHGWRADITIFSFTACSRCAPCAI